MSKNLIVVVFVVDLGCQIDECIDVDDDVFVLKHYDVLVMALLL
jgi:hypothetical protein